MSIAQKLNDLFEKKYIANLAQPKISPFFPKLHVTSSVSQKIQYTQNLRGKLNRTLFVFVQHLLESTGSLLVELNKCGISFENMIGKGKSYSTCKHVSSEIKKLGVHLIDDPINHPVEVGSYRTINNEALIFLWGEVKKHLENHLEIENIIILDEGGRCVERMPHDLEKKYSITAIEQTRGGLYSPALREAAFPIILVATSAIKQTLESDLIANVVLRKLEMLICNRRIPNDSRCGVIGNGAVGKSVVKYLINAGLNVIVYDVNYDSFDKVDSQKFTQANSLEALLMASQVVFGCTGKDTLSQLSNLSKVIHEDKFFISCSSEDREFYSLLQLSKEKQNWLDDVVVEIADQKKITIINGGFPINFDHEPVSVPSKAIDLTRALLLGSIAQAASYLKNYTRQSSSLFMLSPAIQKYVAKKWLYSNNFQRIYPKELLDNINDISWIRHNSGGTYQQIKVEVIFDSSYLLIKT